MRNRIQGKQLNRDSEHRRAMLRNLAAGLFEHGQIETTMPKAKAVHPFIEKIITIAKKGGLHARRQIEQRLNDRKIHAWVADSNVPDSCKDNPWFDLPAASDIEFNRYGELRKAPRLVQHVMTAVAGATVVGVAASEGQGQRSKNRQQSNVHLSSLPR